MKPSIFTFSILIILGIFLFALFQQLAFPDANIKFLGESKRVELAPDKPVQQTLSATQNYFQGIQIFMGDTGLSFSERIEFSLLDASCSEVLTQKTMTSFSFQSERAARFSFDPIKTSKDTTYCLSIRYLPGSTDRSERPFIRATEHEAFHSSSYTDFSKNMTYTGRSLQIRPLYASPSFTDRLQILENRLSQYKPALFKGSILIIGFLAILFGIAFISLIRRKTTD